MTFPDLPALINVLAEPGTLAIDAEPAPVGADCPDCPEQTVRLGCGTHTAWLADRDGRTFGKLTEVSAVSWGRILDDTSEARVTVTAPGPGCCNLLQYVDSWATSLVLYRKNEDGTKRVWEGPVTSWEETGSGVFTIGAQDVTAWLDHRTVHATQDFTATDLASIGEAYIRDAFDTDDPDVLRFLYVLSSGVLGDRHTDADTAYAGDELRELLRTGLDMSVVLRRIILGPEASFGQLPDLSEAAFSAGVTISQDGRNGTTRAVVRGSGVSAAAGGTDPRYGLLETLVSEESILDVASAQSAADQRVAAGNPVPVGLRVPDGSLLSPETPVDINALIPGVTANVTARNECRTLASRLRLTRVTVTETAGTETVQVTLNPVGTL